MAKKEKPVTPAAAVAAATSASENARKDAETGTTKIEVTTKLIHGHGHYLKKGDQAEVNSSVARVWVDAGHAKRV